MKSLSHRKQRCAPRGKKRGYRLVRIESLEKRQLLAGDVLASVDSPSGEFADTPAEVSSSSEPVIRDLSTDREAEGENTSSVHFRFDYTHDTGFFKNNPARQALLEQAGQFLTDRLSDTLAAIPASTSSYTWQAHYTNPTSGANTRLPNGFSVAANEIVVFVGTRNLQSLDESSVQKTRAHADGINAPFSYSCSTGTQAQCDAFGSTLLTRGEGVTSGSGANDFAPFVGSISFDSRSETVNAWNFDDEPLEENQLRFMTFAQHELAHILGHGVSQSFINRISGGRFNGPKTDAAYVGSGHVPLNGAHIAQSVASEQPTIMTASIDSNELFSALDFAVLDDIGWQLTGDARPTVNVTTQSAVVTEGVGSIEVTATLSAAPSSTITIPVSITGAAASDIQLSSTAFVFAPSQRTATITVNVTDDTADETTEAVTIALNDIVTVKQGSTTDFRLTIFDDDGVDWSKVPRLDPAAIANTLAIPGDNQPRSIVFRAAASQTLSVTATNVDQISEAVLLIDKNQNVIGQYGSTGLASAALVKDEPYALVFFPRLTARNFSISLPAGFDAATPRTNVLFPQDVNGGGTVTEVDALQIINQLNLSDGNPSIDAPNVSGVGFYDVSGDKQITAVDALQVINYLNNNGAGSEPAGELTLAPSPDSDTTVPRPGVQATAASGLSGADITELEDIAIASDLHGDKPSGLAGWTAEPTVPATLVFVDRVFAEDFSSADPEPLEREVEQLAALL
ncbi:hypothetical protein FHS27_006034 [Rhodopirellula rubra]|uniref:Extracellular nuclease n=1 Tax=Aporhodopirellula rubra TaxID=980271 RepID=A0A7W5H960_9BACT|nr:dockerin type I domain-containing protein [Aporhodopirellula rubra]MBB3210188.1 hypothetical protein [Aporhodopirellula rubra]